MPEKAPRRAQIARRAGTKDEQQTTELCALALDLADESAAPTSWPSHPRLAQKGWTSSACCAAAGAGQG
jgi:hypothetical protein